MPDSKLLHHLLSRLYDGARATGWRGRLTHKSVPMLQIDLELREKTTGIQTGCWTARFAQHKSDRSILGLCTFSINVQSVIPNESRN
jgi:hypothetical protein